MSAKILIVEDEQILAEVLRDYLKNEGFDPVCLDNGSDVVPWVRKNTPDLVLLDLMLPGRNGFDICKELRTFSGVGIIMVTARVEEIDRLLGLELGADDYVCKPYSPREVVARVKTVLRRTGGEAVLATGLVMDESCYRARFHGRELSLTAVEFNLLLFLSASPGRIYSRQQLMNRIYPDERAVSDRSIDTHIKNVRKKLAAVAPEAEFIHSIYGVGYKFEP